jgi:hypothetical protein
MTLVDRTGNASQDNLLALTQRWMLSQKKFPCKKYQSVKSNLQVHRRRCALFTTK